ncbi:MAG: GatB/YqeY domain-containing protein [Actinobacteria bacterium]|nr:GatB/YqeY domain-containing protein [Actinomycetota bacterium]MBI3686402.1 GatB/YqeY domain-containing protein [Actinomycetota bacterium]
MSELKARLRDDLSIAMKARDEVTTATLRMALTAITTEEVAGKRARVLSDAEVLAVLLREAKKRREAVDAFDAAGRVELADRERAESAVLDRYLPTPLTGAELADLVRAAIVDTGAGDPSQLGQVMKVVQPRVAGRAGGTQIVEEVKRQLSSG